jgi:hypothetical protein
VVDRFCKGISETFFYTKTISYNLKPEDLFLAIDKLRVSRENLILIFFGINIDYYKQFYRVKGLEEKNYNGIDILSFSNYHHHLVGESCFLLEKSDLPSILYNAIEDDLIEKYSLFKIDETHNLYGSVIDLNLTNSDHIRESLDKPSNDRDLKKSVYISINFMTEVRWKKTVSSIMLKIHSRHQDTGLTIDLKDIK